MTALLIAISAPGSLAAEQVSLLDTVKGYADTMIYRGRDHYGPQQTWLILSALDRKALEPFPNRLAARPEAPGGVRNGDDRVGDRGIGPLVGANPQHDQDLLRLFYALSDLTGIRRYQGVADREIKWFFTNAAAPTTHFLAWGEHLFWDTMADEVKSDHYELVHELSDRWLLWDRCYELAPEPCRDFALGLWNYQIADHNTGAFDRQVDWARGSRHAGLDFARHGGYFIQTWAAAYAHTKEETFLQAIEVMLKHFESKRHPKTGLINQSRGAAFAVMTQSLSMAIDCDWAAGLVPEPLASRLKQFAAREDEIFCSLPHAPRDRGFLNRVMRATGLPEQVPESQAQTVYTTPWESRYGGTIPTAVVAMMCVTRYEQTHQPAYRDLAIAAADAYLTSVPEAEADVWPGTFAQVITTELAAFRWTQREVYLERARALADEAVKIFWQDNPLPRASTKTDHYESITGAPSLALALLEVHAATNHLTLHIPGAILPTTEDQGGGEGAPRKEQTD